MNYTIDDVYKFIDLVENTQLESKPTIKMRYLSEANTFSTLALSVYFYNLVPKCSPPKWNSIDATISDVITAVSTLITKGEYDARSYYILPFIVQKVLYYMSGSNNLGLQASHIQSTINILPKSVIYSQFNTTPIEKHNLCPRCATEKDLDDADVCSNCLNLLYKTLEYRVGDFTLYGVSMIDFKTKVHSYEVEVQNGRYTFIYTNTNKDYPYQGALPFVEYQDDISILM